PLALFRQERSPQVGASAEKREERWRGRDTDDALCALLQSERGIPPYVERLLLEDRRFAQPVVVLRNSSADDCRPSGREAGLRVDVGQEDDPIGLRERQRLEHYRAHDTEDRGIRGETHDEREQGRGCESSVA